MANVYTNYKTVLTTNELTTVYTVPAETTAIIKSIRVLNTTYTPVTQADQEEQKIWFLS